MQELSHTFNCLLLLPFFVAEIVIRFGVFLCEEAAASGLGIVVSYNSGSIVAAVKAVQVIFLFINV